MVLAVDEKIEALDRTQPGLPMKPGRAGTMTHDYKRHGTTTLFAALNVPDGTIIGQNMKRHPSGEWSDDDYDVLADGVAWWPIMKAAAKPADASWLWTLAYGYHEDRTPTHGYEPTREAAMAAFAKSWRR